MVNATPTGAHSPADRPPRPPRLVDEIVFFPVEAGSADGLLPFVLRGVRMRRVFVRAATLTLGLGLLPVGAPCADPVAPFVDPPFTSECGAIHHFGEGVAPPVDGCAFDPLCVEYEKRDITATNGGAIDFLAAEPARFAIAIPKCRYWQLDHWRVQASPGAPTIVGWDGDYWFNKRNSTGAAELNNFTIGGQPAGAGEVADLIEPLDPDLAQVIRSYGAGPGGGGGASFPAGSGFGDPSCGAPEACTDDPAVSKARAAVAAQCDCATAARHDLYLDCVRDAVAAEVAAGRLSPACSDDLVSCASRSTCGWPGAVTCYRTDATGSTTCDIRRDPAACRAPQGGTAAVGDTTSCCDPRTVEGCS